MLQAGCLFPRIMLRMLGPRPAWAIAMIASNLLSPGLGKLCCTWLLPSMLRTAGRVCGRPAGVPPETGANSLK